jgi:hypothetical protein
MATESVANPALASDPSKIGVYGASTEQLSEYQKSLADQIQALEQRYANPNWFKVASGFLKPQLGGFGASLGSASEALGESIEQNKAAAIPIAQMRAQLAQSNIMLNAKTKAAEMAKNWEAENPGKPYPPELMAKIAGYDKDLAERLGVGVKQNLDQRTLSQKEQEQQINILQNQRQNLENLAAHGQIPAADFKKRALAIDRQLMELQRVGPFGNPTRTIDNSEGLTPPPSTTDMGGQSSTGQGMSTRGASGNASAAGSTAPSASAAPSSGGQQARPSDRSMLPEVHPRPSVNFGAMSPIEQEQAKNDMRISTERALADDKYYQEQYQKLRTFSSAIGDAQAITRAKETIQKMAKEDPNGFHSLTDAVREAGPIVAAVNDGFAFHAGSLAANISLPASTYIAAGLNKDKRTDYDRLLNAFAVLASAGMHREGVTPQSYVNHPGALQNAMKQYAGIGQTGPAAYTIAMANALKFQEEIELSKLLEHEFKNRTKPNSQARYADAFNSPNVKSLHDIFEEQSRALMKSSTSQTRRPQ